MFNGNENMMFTITLVGWKWPKKVPMSLKTCQWKIYNLKHEM